MSDQGSSASSMLAGLIIAAEQLHAHQIETEGVHLGLNQLRQGGHFDQMQTFPYTQTDMPVWRRSLSVPTLTW
jgi:hypothetical protein